MLEIGSVKQLKRLVELKMETVTLWDVSSHNSSSAKLSFLFPSSGTRTLFLILDDFTLSLIFFNTISTYHAFRLVLCGPVFPLIWC